MLLVIDINPCILHFKPNPIHGEIYSWFLYIYNRNTALYKTIVWHFDTYCILAKCMHLHDVTFYFCLASVSLTFKSVWYRSIHPTRNRVIPLYSWRLNIKHRWMLKFLAWLLFNGMQIMGIWWTFLFTGIMLIIILCLLPFIVSVVRQHKFIELGLWSNNT